MLANSLLPILKILVRISMKLKPYKLISPNIRSAKNPMWLVGSRCTTPQRMPKHVKAVSRSKVQYLLCLSKWLLIQLLILQSTLMMTQLIWELLPSISVIFYLKKTMFITLLLYFTLLEMPLSSRISLLTLYSFTETPLHWTLENGDLKTPPMSVFH